MKTNITNLAWILGLLVSMIIPAAPVRAEGSQFTQLVMATQFGYQSAEPVLYASLTSESDGFEGIEITPAGHALKDLFRQNNDKILDWAIASSVEGVFYYGNGGRHGGGGQVPLLYVGKGIVSGDLGYVNMAGGRSTPENTEGDTRGNLAIGASIRVNRILEVHFPNAAAAIKNFNETTRSMWDGFFFGPAYTYLATEDEHVGWFKCGIRLWGNKKNS